MGPTRKHYSRVLICTECTKAEIVCNKFCAEQLNQCAMMVEFKSPKDREANPPLSPCLHAQLCSIPTPCQAPCQAGAGGGMGDGPKSLASQQGDAPRCHLPPTPGIPHPGFLPSPGHQRRSATALPLQGSCLLFCLTEEDFFQPANSEGGV